MAKVPVIRKASDVSPKVSSVAIIGAVSVVVQAVVSGDFNGPEVATAVTFLIATAVAYFRKDSIDVSP